MKTLTAAACTQVNVEDKGPLAKLVEAGRANYNDRYNDELCCHWGDSILGLNLWLSLPRRKGKGQLATNFH